jgi:hypothetical protein
MSFVLLRGGPLSRFLLRKAKEEAERLQKEEEMRKAKEEAERLEREEGERKAKEETERLLKEEEERKVLTPPLPSSADIFLHCVADILFSRLLFACLRPRKKLTGFKKKRRRAKPRKRPSDCQH